LEAKREQLEELEKSEREARRLEEALGRGRGGSLEESSTESDDPMREPAEEGGEPQPQRLADEQSAYLPPHPGPNPARRRVPGMGFISALTYTLHGMMDVDPETARRNSITKTRETISQVSKYYNYITL
jgi:sorting nexin-41/42